MSATPRRIRVLAGVLAAALVTVLLGLWFVMVEQHDVWLLRSFANRWSFRDVPPHRGAILDRQGRVLVQDVPCFELSISYRWFRRRHPVGAAVHGANLLARARPELQGVQFMYSPGPRGPEAACAELLALPLEALRGGALPEDTARDVRYYAVSLLAGLTGRSRGQVQRRWAEAGADAAVRTVGDVLPGFDAASLAGRFAARAAELRELDRRLRAKGARGELMDKLDELRRDWYAASDETRDWEEWLVPVAGGVDFETAAALRGARAAHPGLALDPAVRRERLPDRAEASVLTVLLGSVADLRRSGRHSAVLQERLALGLSEDDLDVLVPERAVPSESAERHFRQAAESAMTTALLRREREGTSGIELTQDARLSGLPGLRLVERDKRAREMGLWSALQVAPGRDLQLTIDLDLQDLLESTAQAFLAEMRALPGAAAARLDVGIALLDAWSGDVLAVGGAPLRADLRGMVTVTGPDGSTRREPGIVEDALRSQPPGLGWLGPGDIGSVAKPFVVLEQLAAARAGRPHTALADFHDCSGRFPRPGRQPLGCGKPHGPAGREPLGAIAESCNIWFYQAATGLGADGVHRALLRFGLVPPGSVREPDDGLRAAWLPRPAELPVGMAPHPQLALSHDVLRRAIGYGVQASPLHVARAYAALATGVLPTPGLLLGEARPRLPLPVPPDDLLLVREGLRDCVVRGTAHRVTGIQLLPPELFLHGKTGTAEVTNDRENNAWFAGFVGQRAESGVQLCFAAVVYQVPHGQHGGDVAGDLMARLLDGMGRSPQLHARYLKPEAGR